jgi:lipopolysaccharide/colanic/teichoic acid biosynthesis glycosyltransferase
MHTSAQLTTTRSFVSNSLPERGVARVSAFALLVLSAPLLLVIALFIWLEDRGPVVFAHYRIGRNGRPFRCFKFRTMVRDASAVLDDLLASDPELRAQWERDQKLEDDPRVTRIGHFLRRTSLDELPQLFNIVCGDMAFVGPRPIVVQELTRYGVWKRHYLSVPPGLTGLWQVSGRSDVSYDQRVALDRDYVEQHSWLLDALIVARTFKVIALRHGAR